MINSSLFLLLSNVVLGAALVGVAVAVVLAVRHIAKAAAREEMRRREDLHE